MREAARLKVLKLGSLEGGRKVKSTKTRRRSDKVDQGTFREKLLQAGIEIQAEYYLVASLAIGVGIGSIFYNLGVLVSVFSSLAIIYYLTYWWPEERALKRRSDVISLLPGFIDGLASALGTGFNIDAAVIQASESVPPGILRNELNRVVNCLHRGLTIDEAFQVLRERITGREVISVAVSIQLFHGMGGRMLEPFRRLARKIREQQVVVEKANRDLVQIKLAFNILFGLSLLAPLLLFLRTPDYLNSAVQDPLGQLIIQVAVVLELCALLAYKKLILIKV